MIIFDLNFVEIEFQRSPRTGSRSRYFVVPYDRRVIATLPNPFRRFRGEVALRQNLLIPQVVELPTN